MIEPSSSTLSPSQSSQQKTYSRSKLAAARANDRATRSPNARYASSPARAGGMAPLSRSLAIA
jgi:hypothetical protein